MPPKRITLRDETRKMIFDVYIFMLMEAENGIQINLKAVQKRTAAATGVSLKTVTRLVAEINSGVVPANRTPAGTTRRPRKKKVTGLESFDQGLVRRIIHSVQRTENTPTLHHLQEKLKEHLNFAGSATSLRRILNELGFKWKKDADTKGRVLIENTKIRFSRIQYLKQIAKHRDEGRPIVYIGLCSVNSTLSKKPGIRKGYAPHVMALLAGSETMLLSGALLTFSVNTIEGEYNISDEAYENWLNSHLIPNLPEHAVVVVGSTPYNNRLCEPIPKSTAKRSEMEDWLNGKGIDVGSNLLKPQLYEIICSQIPKKQNFAIDILLEKHNHHVLRLPPKHPDLNPIELTWPIILNCVLEQNVSGNVETVKSIVDERCKELSEKEWQEFCQTVRQIEDEYRSNEMAIDKVTDKITIIEVDDDFVFEKNSDDENTEEEMEND